MMQNEMHTHLTKLIHLGEHSGSMQPAFVQDGKEDSAQHALHNSRELTDVVAGNCLPEELCSLHPNYHGLPIRTNVAFISVHCAVVRADFTAMLLVFMSLSSRRGHPARRSSERLTDQQVSLLKDAPMHALTNHVFAPARCKHRTHKIPAA